MIPYIVSVILLILICIAEAVLLFLDHGIIFDYICKAKEMSAREGYGKVLQRSLSILLGILNQNFHPCRFFCRNNYQNENPIIHIAYYPTGGLGDYIISSVLIDELQMYAPCTITVFCEKISFGNAVFGKRPNVTVTDYQYFEAHRNSYDLALKVEHFIHVLNMSSSRTQKYAPELYWRIQYITDHWDQLYVNLPNQAWRERIQFERCKALNLNRWTELRMGKAFRITMLRSGIPMNIDALHKLKYPEISSNAKYITVNFGADQMRKGKTQIKIWPLSYFEQFIALFKDKYPDFKVFQLGASDSVLIPGADTRLIGVDLEITKWILKYSSCHIDCEGGLVHLATQLSTPCIVTFGPTPQHMYGYPQNINLVGTGCTGCMGIHDNWAYECYRNIHFPECLLSITPEIVLDSCSFILQHTQQFQREFVSCNEQDKIHFLSGNIAIFSIPESILAKLNSDDNMHIVIYYEKATDIATVSKHYKQGLVSRYSSLYSVAADTDYFDYVIADVSAFNHDTAPELQRIMKIDGILFLVSDASCITYRLERKLHGSAVQRY